MSSSALQVSLLWGIGIYLLHGILESHKTKRLFQDIEQQMHNSVLNSLNLNVQNSVLESNANVNTNTISSNGNGNGILASNSDIPESYFHGGIDRGVSGNVNGLVPHIQEHIRHLSESERVKALESNPQGRPTPYTQSAHSPYNRLGVDIKYNTIGTNSVSPYDSLFEGHSLDSLSKTPAKYNPHHHFTGFAPTQPQQPQPYPSKTNVGESGNLRPPQQTQYTIDSWHVSAPQ